MDEPMIGATAPSDIEKSTLLAMATEGQALKFLEPWHAQIFGLAMALAQAGVFTWADWVDTFSSEIRTHPQREDEGDEAAYYRQWSAALISLLSARGALSEKEISRTMEDWRRSYLATEHGDPIVFRRDLPPMADIEDHHHHHHADSTRAVKPIAVSGANSAV